MPRREGQFLAEDYFTNNGGLNTADSPFLVQASEATDGQNFDFLVPGGFKKRGGHLALNTVADSQLKTKGLGLWNKPDTARKPIRAAGVKLQVFDPSAFTFTSLSEDTSRTSMGTATITIASPGVVSFTAHGLVATDPVVFTTSGALPTGITAGTTYYVKTVLTANTFTITNTPFGTVITTSGSQSGTHTLFKFTTAFFTTNTTQPVVFSMFNQPSTGVLWAAGGGASSIYGVYSTSKVTANGVVTPTGSISATPGGSGGAFASAGYYRYAVAYHKASTGALGNADLFKEAHVTTTDQKVTIDVSTLSNLDTVKYDSIYIYRSSVSVAAQGNTEFTAGDLISILSSGTTTYLDNGSYVSTSELVPVADSTILDNSPLPSGTYRPLTTFKRRLVTAKGTTLYLSDTNKPESWPTIQTIDVPSGGEITALGIISLTSPLSTDTDEALIVHKQSECWILTGDGSLDTNDVPNWSLKFVSNSGAVTQAAVVQAEGYIAWINYKGVFLWNGSGKPARASRKIWDKFQQSGDLDKSLLGVAFGIYSQKRNEIQWYVSSNALGEQLYVLKLDLTHTITGKQDGVGHEELDGVFTPDLLSTPFYGGMSFVLASDSIDETIYFGDNAGFMYSGFTDTGDGATGSTSIEMIYTTPYLYQETPGTAKKYNKVLLWVLDNGLYDIEMTFWSDYKNMDSEESSLTQAADPNPSVGNGVWDVGLWDVATFDSAVNRIRPILFNLPATQNNAEGDCIRLSFSQTGSTQTPIIYGFTIYYSIIGLRH